VSRMQQVEDTIGESNPILSCRSPAGRFRPCRYFRRGVPRFQSLLMTNGWKCRTRSLLSGSLMTSS
jgi:hypothetical protein